MKQVMLCNGEFVRAESEDELEDIVWEEVERHITVIHGGPNLCVEHERLVETLFDQTMATMEDSHEE